MTDHEAVGVRRRPRVVVLQHHERVRLGSLAPRLEADSDMRVLRGFDDPAASRREIDALIASADYDAVVSLGSPAGVYETDEHPHLRDSLRLMADALRRDIPLLGLCLGSQMLAHLAGARVFVGSERDLPPEVGYLPMTVTPEGAVDPVMAIYAPPPPPLFWHQDTHDLPDGAVLLASTDLYEIAAFRVGRWAYGMQFHLETTADMLPEWIAQSPLPGRAGMREADTAALLAEGRSVDATVRERGDRLARTLVDWAAEAARGPRAPRGR